MAEERQAAEPAAPPAAGWRLKLGGAIFGLSILGPLGLLPLVASLGLSTEEIAAASGAILIGAEVLGITAIAVMGKPGYTYLKSRALALIGKYGPPRRVSRTRYRIGLVFIFVPILLGWLAPYLAAVVPELPTSDVSIALFFDATLVVGLLLAGGDFWDKLRALFVHGATASFPEPVKA